MKAETIHTLMLQKEKRKRRWQDLFISGFHTLPVVFVGEKIVFDCPENKPTNQQL